MANTVTYSRSVSGAGYLGLDSTTGAYLYTTGEDSNGKIIYRSDVEPSSKQLSLWQSAHPGSDPRNSYYNTTTDELDLRPFKTPDPIDTATTQPDAPNATAVPASDSLSKGEELMIQKSGKLESTAKNATSAIKTKANLDDAKASVVSIGGPKWTGAGGGRGGQGGPTAAQAAQNTAIQTFEIPKPIPNPLHDYATYTYGITLYILSAEDFNNLQKADANQLNAWKPTKALISSGGAHNGSERDVNFKDDFYFDNLKMTTVIGMNANTRGTNSIQLSFTVIEPYGLTLLDRIIEAAKSLGCQNYQTQPYLLEIDFYGSSDLGKMATPIRNLKKRIPIRWLDMKIRAGSKGSEYQINCTPYNHDGFSENTASTPINLEVTAGTVKEFFNNTFTNISEQIAAKDKAKEDKKRAEKPTATAEDGEWDQFTGEYVMGRVTVTGPDTAAVEAATKIIESPYQVDSYTGAVNAWHQKIVDNTHYKISNEIEFVIDDEIANSSIVVPSKTNPVRSSFSGTTVADKKASAQGNDSTVSSSTPAAQYDKTKMNFNVNAGTNVVEVINMVLKNSQYIRQQVVDKTAGEVEFYKDRTVDYFKIIPQIILKEFDPLRNTYATKTIYHIKKYSYFNSKHPNLPYGSPDGAVKEYNYIYTGKNLDIIDFNIEFNTAYFTSKVVDRDNKETTNAAAGADVENKPDKGDPPTGSGPDSIAGNKSMPVSSEMNGGATGTDTARTALVNNAMNSIYTNSGGDMIQANMKILGDPHFIKQDDLYTNPGMSNYQDKKVMLNDGTLMMDAKEIFCRINFKTPVDMDPKTGLVRTDGRYSTSKFSGFYKIIKIDSEFSRGQFVQTMETVRIFDKAVQSAMFAQDRQEQYTEEADIQNSSTESRTPSLADSISTNQQTPTIPTPINTITKKVEETFKSVSDRVAAARDNVASAVAAKGIQDKLTKDLENAKTLDIGQQKAEDGSSPLPENP